MTGDDERIVERVDEHQTGAPLPTASLCCLRLRVAVAEQHDFRPELAHRLDLDFRRRLRHDDDRADAEARAAKRHTLRVIAGARAMTPRARSVGVRCAILL